METPQLSVVIPALNEGKTIVSTIQSVHAYLSRERLVAEIVVVNDGSTDDTVAATRRLTDSIRNLRIIDNPTNRGKGAAVRQGMLEATGAIRLFMDADNATTIDHFDAMRPLFAAGYDVVIGTRDPKDAPGACQLVPQSRLKRLLGDVGNLVIQLTMIRGVWDTQCGFKAVTAQAAEDIFASTTIDRWGFDIEVLALASRFGMKIGKVPVRWKNNPDSRVRMSSYATVLLDIVRIWRRLPSRRAAGAAARPARMPYPAPGPLTQRPAENVRMYSRGKGRS